MHIHEQYALSFATAGLYKTGKRKRTLEEARRKPQSCPHYLLPLFNKSSKRQMEETDNVGKKRRRLTADQALISLGVPNKIGQSPRRTRSRTCLHRLNWLTTWVISFPHQVIDIAFLWNSINLISSFTCPPLLIYISHTNTSTSTGKRELTLSIDTFYRFLSVRCGSRLWTLRLFIGSGTSQLRTR